MATDQEPIITDRKTADTAPANDGEMEQSQRGDNRQNGRGGGRREKNLSRSKRKNFSTRERTQDGWGKQKRRRLDEHGNTLPGRDGEPAQPSHMSIPFSAEEIAAEERRPKRKVAVLVGYAGTGYKGMQINHQDKTIEGDLFAAFVAAGAISKANANDPKKSSLVRCARTDKGVHAAGNVISLKLIIEDEGVVQKINDNLPEQIRVWGMQRTNNSFSCYQACDSRWYEYLLPTYSLLPPHPSSYLGKQMEESARERGVYDEMMERLGEVRDYWSEVDKNEIVPILERLDPDVRAEVLGKMHSSAEFIERGWKRLDDIEHPRTKPAKTETETSNTTKAPSSTEEAAPADDQSKPNEEGEEAESADAKAKAEKELSPAEQALREIKAAYVAAKRRYRITPARREQLQAALNEYVGTRNFHNYTVDKSFSDPSAKRLIRSFTVNPQPIQIRDTEWLSLKVHGQSFMMHQIRKMVAMAVLVTRCGAPLERVRQSYEAKRISIPKAPGLGLLLERPVFEQYNKRATNNLGKEALDFAKYDKEIEEFKHKQIYSRMWDVEEKENVFHMFFNQLDNFKTPYFLWVTAAGFDAAYERVEKGGKLPEGLEDVAGDEGGEVDETGS
ncbi:uncharacterized protein E0L32_006948 [Thyridium curvatum]|uniref:tRNA pseudouridine synthase 1 n=1 Tax=Thyridium curvatum TaxID=1093900 RepID=A0A507B5H6_9PEZI|nr:uncharacterized protein E0L32_006948 [Thyridium curvatum]TPX12301.1 hypothetical protein E0L32_006948 [Thyridium curvatum]